MMLKLGSNPNAIDSFGRTTLHFLCEADTKGEVLPWLIQKNTHENRFLCINAQSTSGVTPLMLACKVANAKIIVELLKNGASPFLKDQLGRQAENYFVINPKERNHHQSQIPKLIEKAKYQWLQQVDQKQLDEKQPIPDDHFQEFRQYEWTVPNKGAQTSASSHKDRDEEM